MHSTCDVAGMLKVYNVSQLKSVGAGFNAENRVDFKANPNVLRRFWAENRADFKAIELISERINFSWVLQF